MRLICFPDGLEVLCVDVSDGVRVELYRVRHSELGPLAMIDRQPGKELAATIFASEAQLVKAIRSEIAQATHVPLGSPRS